MYMYPSRRDEFVYIYVFTAVFLGSDRVQGLEYRLSSGAKGTYSTCTSADCIPIVSTNGNANKRLSDLRRCSDHLYRSKVSDKR